MQESYTDTLSTIYDLVSDSEDIINAHFATPETLEGRHGVRAMNKLRDALTLILELNKRIQQDRAKELNP